eukprot:m.96089 g.96089  ORF g.96089 m.96089 type:complete len:60 (+) comp13062_c0_seq24:2930-3109(+)
MLTCIIEPFQSKDNSQREANMGRAICRSKRHSIVHSSCVNNNNNNGEDGHESLHSVSLA